MSAVIQISKLTKTYASGLQALKGIVTPTSGSVIVDGHDIEREVG